MRKIYVIGKDNLDKSIIVVLSDQVHVVADECIIPFSDLFDFKDEQLYINKDKLLESVIHPAYFNHLKPNEMEKFLSPEFFKRGKEDWLMEGIELGLNLDKEESFELTIPSNISYSGQEETLTIEIDKDNDLAKVHIHNIPFPMIIDDIIDFNREDVLDELIDGFEEAEDKQLIHLGNVLRSNRFNLYANLKMKDTNKNEYNFLK